MVVQYAVLEAKGKVNGIGEISHPSPSQTLYQFGCRFKYITTSNQGVNVQNLIKIDTAVAAMRMHQKTSFRVGFFVTSSIVRSASCRYLIYSEADFEVFRPAGATRCTDGGEMWHLRAGATFHHHRCNDKGVGPQN